MSAALVRQALEFVDPDENKCSDKRKRGSRSQVGSGQEPVTQIKEDSNSKTTKKIPERKSSRNKNKRILETETPETREVISKLLKLSETTVDKDTSEKVIKRSVTGKPVFDKIEVKKDEEKPILFPDDPPNKKKTKRRY